MIDNVPNGVAATGSFLSSIGFNITELFETAFSTPTMTEQGYGFSLDVLKRVRMHSLTEFHLGVANQAQPGSDFYESWSEYIKTCTIRGIEIGQLSKDDLFRSPDFISALNFDNTFFHAQIQIGATPESLPCSEAYDQLETYTQAFFLPSFKENVLPGVLDLEQPAGAAEVEAVINDALNGLGVGPAPQPVPGALVGQPITADDYITSSVLVPIYYYAVRKTYVQDGKFSYADQIPALSTRYRVIVLPISFSSHDAQRVRALAPWRRTGLADIDDQKLIAEQIFDQDVDVRHDRDGVWLDDTRVRTLSIKTFPPTISFGQMTYLIGDLFSGSRGLNFPFMLTTNLFFPDQQKTRTGLNAKRQWTTNMAFGPMKKWVPQIALRRHDYETLFASLENGHKLVRISSSLAIFADDEVKADAWATTAINYWAEYGITLMADRFVPLPIFLNLLPFGVDQKVIVDLGRYRTVTTEHATCLLPLFADWKGASTPRVTLLSRSGQVTGIDLFDSSTNYNGVIAAQSGSGKSFFANDLIYAYLAAGAQVWVIDIGRSYEKIASILGGEFVEFDKASQIGLNPFALVQDYDDEADMLEGLVAAMAAPTERLSDLQKSALSRSLRQVWGEHGPNTTIDQLAEALRQSSDQRVLDIGEQLYAFSRAGSYGAYFNGPNTVTFKNDLTVLELEHLRQRRHLQKVVLLQLIYQIQQAMYLGDRSRLKVVIIDEAWDLLTDGDVGKFIEHGYRRFRKYNGAAVTITQSIGDLYASAVGQAVVDNSANMFLLGQKTETITHLAESGRLPLSPFGVQLLKSVHTQSGRFSEIYCHTAAGAGVGRLAVSPFLQLLYSTRPKDTADIEHYRGQGLDVTEAIQAVLQDRQIQSGPRHLIKETA